MHLDARSVHASLSAIQSASAPLQVVWLEQEDAKGISQGEEVTLMDWGNAVVDVWPLLPYHMRIFGLSIIAPAHPHILISCQLAASWLRAGHAVSALTATLVKVCQLNAKRSMNTHQSIIAGSLDFCHADVSI